jgi:aerobic carbon-monoxide dehydrogenase medium subunit
MKPFDYTAPRRLDEAVALLAKTPGARVLAGGSQMLIEPSRSELTAPLLVDLRKVDGLAGIEATGEGVRIGAMTTTAAVAAHAGVAGAFAALAEAASLVGDPQVRNRATLGGAIAGNDPAADVPAALLALDAQVQVASAKGARSAPVESVLGALGAGEVITGVTLPTAAANTGSAYEKIKHPSTCYALSAVAASVSLAGDGSVRACRIAVTGAAAPARAKAAEAALSGQAPTAASIEAAAAKATDGLALRGDAFGSAEYRGHLARVLAARAIARAVERARGK